MNAALSLFVQLQEIQIVFREQHMFFKAAKLNQKRSRLVLYYSKSSNACTKQPDRYFLMDNQCVGKQYAGQISECPEKIACKQSQTIFPSKIPLLT
ncbi:hypothetical protein D3C80_1644100 [compost metagenome]